MRLGDAEARRKKITKERFMLQNEVNSIQVELKDRLRNNRRKLSAEARDQLIRDEEDYYNQRESQRVKFEKKYLKMSGH